jgi:hypothetical protein
VRRGAALALLAALSGCRSDLPSAASRRSADEGYLLGTADTVKQLYWAKQALEAPRGQAPAGRVEYYTWEEPGTAPDGRRLAPRDVGVPVFIPAPAPAGAEGP